jgi:hypothetical protein
LSSGKRMEGKERKGEDRVVNTASLLGPACPPCKSPGGKNSSSYQRAQKQHPYSPTPRGRFSTKRKKTSPSRRKRALPWLPVGPGPLLRTNWATESMSRGRGARRVRGVCRAGWTKAREYAWRRTRFRPVGREGGRGESAGEAGKVAVGPRKVGWTEGRRRCILAPPSLPPFLPPSLSPSLPSSLPPSLP